MIRKLTKLSVLIGILSLFLVGCAGTPPETQQDLQKDLISTAVIFAYRSLYDSEPKVAHEVYRYAAKGIELLKSDQPINTALINGLNEGLEEAIRALTGDAQIAARWIELINNLLLIMERYWSPKPLEAYIGERNKELLLAFWDAIVLVGDPIPEIRTIQGQLVRPEVHIRKFKVLSNGK